MLVSLYTRYEIGVNLINWFSKEKPYFSLSLFLFPVPLTPSLSNQNYAVYLPSTSPGNMMVENRTARQTKRDLELHKSGKGRRSPAGREIVAAAVVAVIVVVMVVVVVIVSGESPGCVCEGARGRERRGCWGKMMVV